MKAGLLYDERYLQHDTGEGHPECPARLTKTWEYLNKQPWCNRLRHLTAKPADETWIESVHTAEYISRVRHACRRGESMLDTPDVRISQASFEIALLAAGGAMVLADELMKGEIQNGFGLLRPPGHHAEKSIAMGFCLFNHIAVLARYLQKHHGLEKIFILDWDVHHGNGTQHAFEEDPSVFYASLHEYPYYPGTGDAYEIGTGPGKGTTLNYPMAAGAGDRDYVRAFEDEILPAMDSFEPEAVLISAGFDAHEADPLAHIQLSTEFYGWMTRQVLEVARKHAAGRVISLLEGGYHLDYLPLSIAEHMKALAGIQKSDKR